MAEPTQTKRLYADIDRLYADTRHVLTALLDRYVALAKSGRCGNWDPETENVVIEARRILEDCQR